MKGTQVLIAPDGGWGWMVVLAFALANMIVVPLIHGFGLIYKETFSSLGMSNTNISVIMNINTSCGMLLGIINGPLLRRFGFRKIALSGGVFSIIGIIATAPATTFGHFIATYSIITSIGFSWIFASYSLALNTYFKKRRNRAAGIAMTITGIGPIFVPHMITILVQSYGAQGCMFIFGAIATHTIATALLLQPVKWHMKKEEHIREMTDMKYVHKEEDKYKRDETQSLFANNVEEVVTRRKESIEPSVKSGPRKPESIWDLFLAEDESEYMEKPNSEKRPITLAILEDELTTQSFNYSEPSVNVKPKRHSAFSRGFSNIFRSLQTQQKPQRKYASQPIMSNSKYKCDNENQDSVNLGNTIKLFTALGKTPLRKNKIDISDKEKYDKIEANFENQEIGSEDWNQKKLIDVGDVQRNGGKSASKTELNSIHQDDDKAPGCCQRFTNHVVQFFDLRLLADSTYVVIMVGISTAIFSEMNFSMLTPFILDDMGLTTRQIASVMSAIAISDIITRFVCPFIGDYFKQTPRMMFVYSVIILILVRTGLIYSESYLEIILAGLGIGVSKGIRTVYSGVIIPNYVSLDRLPCALGLQNVSNGIFVIGFGPLLGVIRDYSGSFTKVMIFLNAVMLGVIVLWGAENWWKTRNSKRKQNIGDNK